MAAGAGSPWGGRGGEEQGRAVRPAGRAGCGAMDKLKRVLSGRDAEEPSGLAEVALPLPGGGPGRPSPVLSAVPEPPPRGRRGGAGGRCRGGSAGAVPVGAWASPASPGTHGRLPGRDTARRLRGSFRARWEARAASKQVSLLFSASFPGYRCDFVRLGHPSERLHCVFCDRMPVLDLGKDFLPFSPIYMSFRSPDNYSLAVLLLDFSESLRTRLGRFQLDTIH